MSCVPPPVLRTVYSTITKSGRRGRRVESRECCEDLGLQTCDRLEDALQPQIVQVLERSPLVLATVEHASEPCSCFDVHIEFRLICHNRSWAMAR